MINGDATARAELDALYAELPRLQCAGKCAESCGPIAMSRAEWHRIIDRVGIEPVATSLTCPLLAFARCTVYEIRPTICRLWGLVETMPCPWGCKPERYLTPEQGYAFLRHAEAIGA